MTEMVDSDGILGNEFYVVLDHIHRYQADINLDEFVLQKSKERFYMLKNDCQQNLNVYRTFEMVKMSQYLRYIELYDTDKPTVKTCITIDDNFQANIVVHGVQLPKSHVIWNTPGLPIKYLKKTSCSEAAHSCIMLPSLHWKPRIRIPEQFAHWLLW